MHRLLGRGQDTLAARSAITETRDVDDPLLVACAAVLPRRDAAGSDHRVYRREGIARSAAWLALEPAAGASRDYGPGRGTVPVTANRAQPHTDAAAESWPRIAQGGVQRERWPKVCQRLGAKAWPNAKPGVASVSARARRGVVIAAISAGPIGRMGRRPGSDGPPTTSGGRANGSSRLCYIGSTAIT